MSYDVYLYAPPKTHPCPNCGHEHETGEDEEEVFSTNYTSNCSRMWDAAGCPLREWAYDRNGIRLAETLIEPLRTALREMRANPDKYIAMNPDNGWGSYDMVLPWLRSILVACEGNPKARVYVSN